MNTPRLIAGILVGKPVGDKIVVSEKALEKSMQENAELLENTREEEIKLADDLQAEVDSDVDNQIKSEKEEGLDDILIK